MTADDLEAFLRKLGLTLETLVGADQVTYTAVLGYTIPAGALAGRTCDVAIQRVETVPYVVPAATSVVQRPGRKGRDDLYFATWAAAYVERLQGGDRSPIQTLAARPPVRLRGQRRLSANTVRGIIAEARSRTLLSLPPVGRAGGTLTDLASAILGSRASS